MGNQLSGGEQQMLAIGRALMGNPSLLLLDEPQEGLAPVIVDALIAALHRLRQDEGSAIVLVEQHARLALEFAPRSVILDRGRLVYDDASQPLLDDPRRLATLIGVGDPLPTLPRFAGEGVGTELPLREAGEGGEGVSLYQSTIA